MRQGRQLEKLVRILESKLAKSSNATVESPKYLIDTFTGRKREHDVVLTIKESHHDLTVSFECKDRNNPVGVPDVEAYHTKCNHTKTNQGVFVSTSGFTKTALEKAGMLGIKCLSIEEVETLDWMLPGAVLVVHTKKYLVARYQFVVESPPELNIDEFDIIGPGGELVTEEMITYNISAYEKEIPWVAEGEIGHKQMALKTPGFVIRHRNSDLELPLSALVLNIEYECVITEVPFTKSKYKNSSNNNELADIAIAPVSIGGITHKLALVDTENGRTMELVRGDT